MYVYMYSCLFINLYVCYCVIVYYQAPRRVLGGCTSCARIPMRATRFPLGASPLREDASPTERPMYDMYVCVYIYICILPCRGKSPRGSERFCFALARIKALYMHMYMHEYIYIYIYIERERDVHLFMYLFEVLLCARAR